MSEMRKVRDLIPGDVIDLEGSEHVSEADRWSVEYDYVVVDSINGGWADYMAGTGQVVLYSAAGLTEPIIFPADTEVSWIQNEETD